MEFHLPDEVTQNITAYMPRDTDMFSPTYPLMNSFIQTVNDLTRTPPELASLHGGLIADTSFSRKAFDVLNVLEEYGIHNDLSNLCGDL
jgi:hypothetical protein